MRGAQGRRARHGAGWGDGEALNPHQGPCKDKYWLRTVLITSLNWAILVFPVGSMWKIHVGFHVEGEGEGWAWRTINHCRYIIHWKHVKRTRQDALDHWKQHCHRSFHVARSPSLFVLEFVTLFNLLSHLNDKCASFQFYSYAFYCQIWSIREQMSIFSFNTGKASNTRSSRIKISLSDSVTAVVLVSISDILFVHSSSEGQGQYQSLIMWWPPIIIWHVISIISMGY